MPIPDPLDEYPIHQAPLSMRHSISADRNFYDRCIMHAFPADGSAVFAFGLGVYPNLGVMDAFATFRRGTEQVAVRASDAVASRMDQRVGPLRVEVVEPLRRIRAVCDAPDLGLEFDLQFEADFEASEEPLHEMRTGARLTLQGCRFVQLGHWTGRLSLDGVPVDLGSGWLGDRDRSWGLRPIGEPEPAGRPQRDPNAGIWWVWAPVALDDTGLVVIAQEDVTGHRSLNHAVGLPGLSQGGPEAQLGWPRFEISYRPGTRVPEAALIHVTDRDGVASRISVQPLTGLSLNIGCGYPGDPEWSHGRWMGTEWVQGSRYDLADPQVAGRSAFSVVDYTAHFQWGERSGTGIFEHACLGRHDPSGFTGWEAMEACL